MDGLLGSFVDVAEMGPEGSVDAPILERVPSWLLESMKPGSQEQSDAPMSVVDLLPLTEDAGWKHRPTSRVVHRYAARCLAAS